MSTKLENSTNKEPKYNIATALYDPTRHFVYKQLVSLKLCRRKYLFIHIPKNGGMSIRAWPFFAQHIYLAKKSRLRSHKYAYDLQRKMYPDLPPGYGHARYIDINKSFRKATIPFAIIRNPWSRVVSRYTFLQKTLGTTKSFDEFLEQRHEYGDEAFYWHRAITNWYPQIDYILDEEENVAVDTLRLEDINGELSRYFQLEGTIKRRNVSQENNRSYKNYYTPRAIQLIADWYQKDIDFFGFDFDTSATRNTYFTR